MKKLCVCVYVRCWSVLIRPTRGTRPSEKLKPTETLQIMSINLEDKDWSSPIDQKET